MREIYTEYEEENFHTAKEDSNFNLEFRLRKERFITTPERPFKVSDQIRFEILINNKAIKLEKYNESKHSKLRLFNSRFMREIKCKKTDTTYEKSRLVIVA